MTEPTNETNENAQRVEGEENEVAPPAETDGPQEPVDDSELEEEQHPTLPEDVNDETPEESDDESGRS